MKRKITVIALCASADAQQPTKVSRIGLEASLQYSNLYYVAPILLRAHRNFFYNLSNIRQKPPPSQCRLE
jgi:hypothetical protein